MKLTNEIINRLDQEDIVINDYIKDDVVKSLLDTGFDHDFIINNIVSGDVVMKSRYTKKEEIKYDEKKAGEHEREAFEAGKEKGEEKEEDKLEKNKFTEKEEEEYDEKKARAHREKDFKEGEKEGEEEVKADMQKAFTVDLMKSVNDIKDALSKEFASKFDELEKSINTQLEGLKNQPGQFKSVPHSAYLEKSMGVKTNADGKKVLNAGNPAHRETIKNVLSKSFGDEKDDMVKKSLGDDILNFGLSGANSLSESGIKALEKMGIVLE